jgi:presenilin-like A22 family membrane protease
MYVFASILLQIPQIIVALNLKNTLQMCKRRRDTVNQVFYLVFTIANIAFALLVRKLCLRRCKTCHKIGQIYKLIFKACFSV